MGSEILSFWLNFGFILGPSWFFGSILGPFGFHFGSISGPFGSDFASMLMTLRAVLDLRKRVFYICETILFEVLEGIMLALFVIFFDGPTFDNLFFQREFIRGPN